MNIIFFVEVSGLVVIVKVLAVARYENAHLASMVKVWTCVQFFENTPTGFVDVQPFEVSRSIPASTVQK